MPRAAASASQVEIPFEKKNQESKELNQDNGKSTQITKASKQSITSLRTLFTKYALRHERRQKRFKQFRSLQRLKNKNHNPLNTNEQIVTSNGTAWNVPVSNSINEIEELLRKMNTDDKNLNTSLKRTSKIGPCNWKSKLRKDVKRAVKPY